MLARKMDASDLTRQEALLAPMYGSRELGEPVPRYELPDGRMPAQVAYQLVHDELNLDGNPALNLASFVTTWMEPEADRLMAESFGRNYIDADEYPQTTEIHNRCVNMLAGLFHAPSGEGAAVGCATVGSSEAIHLAGLAMKWRWRARRVAQGLPTGAPNIVMGANVQVCWEKFARYFDVEARYVPLTGERFVIGVEEAMSMVDENTIGVVGILGSTYTGEYEPVKELNDAIVALNSERGWDVALHVDGASGAFVAPFTAPDLEWDFRLPAVRSINASGHKYGLVYPGVGWVVWRSHEALPEELVFSVNYLGGNMPTFSLNFSRPGAEVVAQYYLFLRLGFEGYVGVQRASREIAQDLAGRIEHLGPFRLLSRGDELPVFAFTTAPEVTAYNVFDVSRRLRERGWLVPAYTFPADREDLSVLRVVIRNGFTEDLAGLLVADLERLLPELGAQPGPLQAPTEATAFHH